MRRETFTFGDLVRLILEILRYIYANTDFESHDTSLKKDMDMELT